MHECRQRGYLVFGSTPLTTATYKTIPRAFKGNVHWVQVTRACVRSHLHTTEGERCALTKEGHDDLHHRVENEDNVDGNGRHVQLFGEVNREELCSGNIVLALVVNTLMLCIVDRIVIRTKGVDHMP